ncbi:cupredoxin domain-containing protein [Cupriavidus pinatubonensis]|uniref:cupredoxin domain-containing protein n=1 Tax=Cupriavidus pinatubonensis TaxID=248026 RepID=UPI0036181EE7
MIQEASFRPQRRRHLAWLAAMAATAPFWTASAAVPRRIAVTARRFVFTPDRIALHKNESVILALTAVDVVMGFSVPDLGIRVDLPPGKTVEVPINAAAAGSHLFLCDIFCGSGHESMNGQIEVS